MTLLDKYLEQRRQFSRWLIRRSEYHVYPWAWLTASFDRCGLEFIWHGDSVIWTWPWRRPAFGGPWISLGFSGNGEFGDARYQTLADIDAEWKIYFEADVRSAAPRGLDMSDIRAELKKDPPVNSPYPRSKPSEF